MKMAEKRNPALVELVLVILFFALSSAVLVQVFVKAHLISEESRGQTLGMVLAEDLLEQWKECPQQPEQLFSPENGWKEEESGGNVRTFRRGCGSKMEPVSLESAFYEVRAELWTDDTEAGMLCHIRVFVNGISDGKTYTELETARYVPG
ncbi:MAG: hypothetical protein HFI20_08730 [Lachnospiraceae bacterium]|jgi:hypothetical protein|nr:hypothetical protein [Lachnospiraceae bacterium]MCI9305731.1 hypothetical protein [Lachnospiraceae bacterium]